MSLDYRNCINFALPYLPINPIVIDVGCNIDPIVEMGYVEWIENWNDDFTILILESLSEAKCIGIEPLHWETYEKRWENDTRVDLLKIGLSDTNCFETIFFPGVHHVISSFYNQECFNQYDIQTKEVECKTLDTLSFELNLEHIDYLKIDTEGAEYKILLGAKKLLEEKRISFIQFEYGLLDDIIPSVELICDLLSEYGYEEVLTSGREKLWINEQIYTMNCEI
jgi:FkbM family methyltransferase